MRRAAVVLSDGPTRAQTRHAATKVFHRGEFQQHLSLLDRFLRWLSRHLGSRSVNVSGGSSSGGSSLLLYLVAVALLAVLVWIVVKVARTWVRSPKVDEESDPEPEVETPRSQSEWRSAAEQAETEGRWKDAMAARYRELVAELVARRVVEPVPGRTTGELRSDVAASAADVSGAFSDATLLFELPWYADAPTGPAENARFKELARTVLAGAPELARRPEAVPV